MKKIVGVLLILVILMALIPVTVAQAGGREVKLGRYITVSGKSTPAWTEPRSTGTSKSVQLVAGTIVSVVSVEKNTSGNWWAKVANGRYIYTDNLTAYKSPSESSSEAGYYTTLKKDLIVYTDPSSYTEKIRTIPSVNTSVYITATHKNAAGNTWGKINLNEWVYLADMQKDNNSKLAAPKDKVDLNFMNDSSGKLGKLSVSWNTDYFLQSASNYNHNLSLIGVALSNAAYSENGDEVVSSLSTLGFSSFSGSYPSKNDFNKSLDRVAYTFAYNKDCKVVAIVIRGTPRLEWFGDYPEWISNVKDTVTGKNNGFLNATQKVMTALQAYMKAEGLRFENTKFFITGHSRGGAVSNLLGADLTDTGGKGIEDRVFVYTFASPCSTNDTRTTYKNIFNICNGNDSVIKWMSGSRHGKTYMANYITVNEHSTEKYLALLNANKDNIGYALDVLYS